MKNLLLTCCLLLLTSIIFAQDVTISIVGLNEKDSKAEVVFEVLSAELINNIDSKTSQLVGQKIIITKEYDEVSTLIKNVVNTGKISSSASIVYKDGSESMTVDLSSVLLKNYSWKLEEGEAIVETFEMIFKTIN